LLIMPSLALAKHRTGTALGNRTLVADATESAFCAFTSGAALLAVGLNAWLGWWWEPGRNHVHRDAGQQQGCRVYMAKVIQLSGGCGRGGSASMDRMSPAPENRALSADQPMVNDYDVLAEAYTAENETSLINAYYARPAILALAGNVAGRRILDAGCGSGPLFAALRDRGAILAGFDSSAGMIEQARRRLGDDADLRVTELGSPLPFPDSAFDDVIAALVLHYLEDWGPALAELRRVLKPGGRLIVAVDHPFAIDML
jgi:predicted TPR repeat methyltransferase